jgi:hypothetical protein
MMRAHTAWLVGVLALADTVPAEPPSADPKELRRSLIGTELTVINYCVRDVRRSRPGSAFDAYVGVQGTMRYVGTEAEIAAFKRCMEAQDFPLEPK